ncbi:hypothetical protein BCL57_001263 [Agromyces flavus]|uniref:Uncharacterized protein n=1 Tax=Agromyces flavus TaxID=589382 RepID=A0A1H1ZJQ8_9MICO|nr:hypothetical protein [Agromyces flavus]MCP2367109.1 hypothetical protein [Agromyces flavus]GGI46382.1 hypothetical protein GCM10010932_14340 [Agromyces flavus]SDT33456.1 hypothetical protein SAMN04489721_3188 [Agromyces flavus]
MDWTFWVGGFVILALWGITQWAFSSRRHSEKTRGRDVEQSDAIVESERRREQGRFWSGFGG